MGYDGHETDTDALRSFALDDAINTLTGEQVAYWNSGMLDQPRFSGKACRPDLDNWLDCRSSESEWKTYKQAFESAMRAGIAVLEKVEFTPEWDVDDDDEATNDAVDAAKAAVEALSKAVDAAKAAVEALSKGGS
jgi:hypothetical protein